VGCDRESGVSSFLAAAAAAEQTVDLRCLLASSPSTSLCSLLLDSSEERRSSTLFDEDVRSDNAGRLLLLAMSNYKQYVRVSLIVYEHKPDEVFIDE